MKKQNQNYSTNSSCEDQKNIVFTLKSRVHLHSYFGSIGEAFLALAAAKHAGVKEALCSNSEGTEFYNYEEIKKLGLKVRDEVLRETDLINKIYKELKPVMDGTISEEDYKRLRNK